MRKLILTLIAAAFVAAAIAPSAQAAPVRECFGILGLDNPRQFVDPDTFDGGVVIAGNVTTRNVSCVTARRFIVRFTKRANQNGTYRGFRCRSTFPAFEAVDTRCTASRGRVIRWQGGA
jgi:hypothetical protein